mmetsp:Transcript_10678/g.22539  ORF Transcript_10678/g.22539 Transcript_10678/m.22539 type:complete len:284 (+) Transcript_10678:1-852(+)
MNVILQLGAISMFFTIFRLFRYFRFQERLNVVAMTLARASVELFHFFLVYIEILLLYALVGHLLFGASVGMFSSYVSSVIGVFNWNVGSFDSSADLISEFPQLGPVYFAVYVICVYLILLNMFLAIVIEAYSKVQSRRGPTITFQLRGIARYYSRYLRDLFRRHLLGQPRSFATRQELMQAVNTIGDTGREQGTALWLRAQLRHVGIPKESAERLCREQIRRQVMEKRRAISTTSLIRELHTRVTESNGIRAEVKRISAMLQRMAPPEEETSPKGDDTVHGVF